MFEFDVERRFSPPPGTDIAHIVGANGTRIELLHRDGAAAGPDVEAAPFEAILVLVKAQPLAEPVDVPPAGVRNCWFRDPTAVRSKSTSGLT